ncbi:sulfite reductase flavoprotein subunit alpha [Chlamydiifrater phoenicopteri]|uniref:sulfite reductase flavoprotein subunit alpha n=1 Tax=Chlamydiifrater phoenicopteri TaxID=2681469 RepID=UPI001BCCB7BF|nr:sulfite reductase flavoprotein subunit alpha [Chlamydiifrater phoenicopteri]
MGSKDASLLDFVLQERSLLTKGELADNGGELVYSLKFSAKNPGELKYRVGDSLAVLPENDPKIVDDILNALSLREKEHLLDPRSGQFLDLKSFLTRKADLDKLPEFSKRLFPNDACTQENGKKVSLRELLLKYRPKVKLEEVPSIFAPLLPRFYSIASSPLYDKNSLELTVRSILVQGAYSSWPGVCSSYICKRLQKNERIHGYISPTQHFTLNENNRGKPLIMIGAGTGIAPYRAFMQERLYLKESAKNYLFFGERKRNTDFYYEDFWKECCDQGLLEVYLAFSRESDQKIYVQDRVLEKSEEIRSACMSGAYIFVCGSKAMGAEIRKAIETILGKELFKNFIKTKRFVADVY